MNDLFFYFLQLLFYFLFGGGVDTLFFTIQGSNHFYNCILLLDGAVFFRNLPRQG